MYIEIITSEIYISVILFMKSGFEVYAKETNDIFAIEYSLTFCSGNDISKSTFILQRFKNFASFLRKCNNPFH